MYQPYQRFYMTMKATGKYRQLLEEQDAHDTFALDFSSNDYLSLSRHPAVLAAALTAGELYGVGATGSRLLSGNRAIFTALETRIAQDKGMDRALIFNSGFQANATVLSSLLDEAVLGAKPLVFFDKLNHASLYQAIRSSGAELIRYRHLDYAHLETCLARYADVMRPKFIVTETVFGMDGDQLDLARVVRLAQQHQTALYLDEAHAVGLFGEQGYGLANGQKIPVPCVIMGTFSKALGASGGYVACNSILAEFLINKAPGFIYSTANSPLVMGAVLHAWQLIPQLHHERAALLARAQQLRLRLQALGFNTGLSQSHIIPIIYRCLDTLGVWHQRLANAGIRVSLVRPPTVPANAPRLRIALNTTHSDADIDTLIQVLAS
jgi:8-amino-7-oxononanoate synthase